MTNNDDKPLSGELLLHERTTASLPTEHDPRLSRHNPAVSYIATLRSEQSIRVVKSRLTKAAQFLGYTDWLDIDWTQMERHWLTTIQRSFEKDGMKPGSINAIVSALRGCAREAFALGQLDQREYLLIKDLRDLKDGTVSEKPWISMTDLKRLLRSSQADSRIHGLRDTAIVSLLIGGGLRRSEVVKIQIKDLHFKERRIKIHGKGKKERFVYYGEELWDNLLTWLDEGRGRHKGPLFTRIYKNGRISDQQLSDQSVYNLVKAFAKAYGGDEFSPHDVRGSFISHLLNDTGDLATISEIVGHSDVSTTKGYDRRGEEAKRSMGHGFSLEKSK